MKHFATLATLALAASTAVAQQLMVNTPSNVVVCQPTLLTWTGGTPPYFLSIVPGNQPTAPALLDFGQVSGNSLTWIANITSGTSIVVDLRDSTGQLAQTAPFPINSGSDNSCLSGSGASAATTGNTSPATAGNTSPPTSNAAPSSPASPSASAPGTTGGPVSIPNTATVPSTTPRPTSSTASSGAAASNSSSTSANAAPTQAANFGAAALLGAAAVALLA